MNKERVITLNITDELGTHNLTVKDFIVKCNICNKERSLYEDDFDGERLNINKCKCGGLNRLDYWLDGIYTDEEYENLILHSKK